MKADRKKAASIGYALVQYLDALVKQHTEVLDATKLRTILNDTSHDTLAAEQELVMAWRLYTQEREKQIARGKFRHCSSPEEIQEARQFLAARKITFDPIHLKGIEYIALEIEKVIKEDILFDPPISWQDVVDEQIRNEEMFKDMFRTYHKHPCYGTCLEIRNAIRKMFEEHRDFYAQRPTEPYDVNDLAHIFEFYIGGPTFGLGEIIEAWDDYLKWRIYTLDNGVGDPFHRCTDEEKVSAKEIRRKLSSVWFPMDPMAREMVESHIRDIICEDIISDTIKWERHKKEEEASKKRYQELRLERIQKHRDAFISKIKSMYGQEIIELISNEDIDHYSSSAADFKNEDELWYSILKKYDFDQNTNSCLYFIRQGTAIKIGITDDLKRRFFQIKTSAALPCEIVNVVYTHHGRKLERKLHQVLGCYKSHLEWFVLPSMIEKMLFMSKNCEDIEKILTKIAGKESPVNGDLFSNHDIGIT